MLKKIAKVISWLKYNPGLFIKHVIIQIKKLMPLPKGPIRKNVNGVLFEFDFNYDAAIKSMYIGGYEIDIVNVMKKVLKKGDTFIDAGANIGYISAIAAGLVGKTGQVHSFEPVPRYFRKLENMAKLNPAYKIVVNQFALGERNGNANIKVAETNIGWNTMVPGFLNNESKIREILEIPVKRLDNYIEHNKLKDISLMKIDVEGFEFPVLKGLSNYFKETECRPVIICEINHSACLSLGYNLSHLFDFMKTYDYNTYSLLNLNVKVDITKLKEIADIVFISRQR